ncbi:MAG: hypothetical protein HY909_27215 [Deltaproteobacteria bacterium]|nr:hypothetical protein [Deltaproteobacteria bacterium]
MEGAHEELLVAAGRGTPAPARWIARLGTLFLALGVAGVVAFHLAPPSVRVLHRVAQVATFGLSGALYLGFLALGVGLFKRPRQGWLGGLSLVVVVLGWALVARRLPPRAPRALDSTPDAHPVRVAPAPR